MKTTHTKQLSDAEVQPIIEFCRKHHGAQARLLVLFNRGLANPTPQPNFCRWLKADATKRTEPLYGAGIRLKAAFTKLKTEFPKKESQK